MANNPYDSLRTALQHENNDTLRLILLNRLANAREAYSYHECVSYAKTALDLARKLEFHSSEAQALRLLGVTNWSHSRYDISRDYLKKAIEIYTNIDDEYNTGQCYNTIGLSFFYQASYTLAIENLLQSLAIFYSLEDSSQVARISNNLGLVYDASGKFELANKYYVQGLNYKLSYRAIRDQYQSSERQKRIFENERIANSLIPKFRKDVTEAYNERDFYKMAFSFSKIGGFYLMLTQFDSALHYFSKAGNIYDSINEPAKYASELLDITKCYVKLNMTKKASEYFGLTLPLLIQEQLNPQVDGWHISYGNYLVNIGRSSEAIPIFKSGLVHSDSLEHFGSSARFNRLISTVYYSTGDFAKAIQHGLLAYQKSDEIGSFVQKKEASKRLYLSYKALGDFVNAIRYQEELHKMIQLQENALMERASQEFEAKFEYQEQAREINSLTRENELKDSKLNTQLAVIYFSLLFAITVITFLILIRGRYKKIRTLNMKVMKQNDSLMLKNDEIELLMKEIHHRVKNNLQIVSNMLSLQKRRTENEKIQAVLEHTQSRVGVIGLIHEHLYKTDNLASISLINYIPDLVDRLINSMYEGAEVKVDYDVNVRDLDLDSIIYIGLITHEIVVNAIKYAFEGSKKPFLKVAMHAMDKDVLLNFKDNGPGINGTKNGFGWTIIQSIVQNMGGTVSHNNSDGFNISITLKDIISDDLKKSTKLYSTQT